MLVAATLLQGVAAVGLLLSPLVVHEAAHYAALRYYAYTTRRLNIGVGPVILDFKKVCVRLWPLSGGIEPDVGSLADIPWRRLFVVAMAGPLASALFAALQLIGALHVTGAGSEGLARIGLLSLFIAMFNLLPLPGLDGGVALGALMRGAGWPAPLVPQRLPSSYFLLLLAAASGLFWIFANLSFRIG